MFFGTEGTRTLFSIKVHHAADVSRYSAIGAENERLIVPGTVFDVIGILPMVGLCVCLCCLLCLRFGGGWRGCVGIGCVVIGFDVC